MIAIVRYVIPVALIHHWLLLHWPSVAGPGVGVIGILIGIIARRRAARAVAECTALINGSIGSRGTADPRALRDLAVVRTARPGQGQPTAERAPAPEVTVRTRRSVPAA